MLSQLNHRILDLLCPGPASGRNGSLRQQILELELRKRDESLAPLFALERGSPAPSAWVGLGSIAYEMVKHFAPRVVVELGSFGGFSTGAIGLALKHLGGERKLYAVDTWSGDAHTGKYGDQVYDAFLGVRHALGLNEIIIPLRMTFDEAADKIPDKIDMLHIDGLHTFAAVSHDFKTYKPLLASNAIVMFHDVYTEFPDMRLFWAMISRRYPSYRIPYSHGLGVIQV
jgi:predicted O-methyltransferase YrrM